MEQFKVDQIKHLIDLEGQKERIVLVLEKVINQLNRKILQSIDPANITKTETLRTLNVLINQHFRDFDNQLQQELIELGIYESTFQTELINKEKEENFKELNKGVQEELLLLLLLGFSFKQNSNQLKQNLKNNINRSINIIYNQQTSKTAAVNTVKANLNTNSAQMKTLARTAATNQLNLSKLETLKKNNVKRYQYVAILDSRTTKICRRLHNKIFEVDDPKAPRPPQHFNCRSSIVPIFDEADIFTKQDTLDEFVEIDGNKNNVDKNGNFKVTNNDIITLNERFKRDKNQFDI